MPLAVFTMESPSMPCPLHVCLCRFDCILLDIMMARTNGVDVAIALQQAFEGSPTPLPPIVAMTANTSAQDVAM